MALAITKDNYESTLASGKPVVIDFWAEWCGPCRMIAPFIEELAGEYADRVVIGKWPDFCLALSLQYTIYRLRHTQVFPRPIFSEAI